MFNSSQIERGYMLNILFIWCVSPALICCIYYSPIPFISIQSGTHSASIDKQRQLQSAAHTFYQQVVHVLKHRVLVEREHPGLLVKVSHVFNTLCFHFNALVLLPLVFLMGFYFSLYVIEISSPSYPGSCQHLLLATMFALNFCYQPVDLVLVIKCGILEILSVLTNNSCALMNQGWFAASTSGSMLLGGAVKLACTRLLQILTVAARWEWRDCEQLQWSVHEVFQYLNH